jgi:UDP-glucose 4-epimerase
MNNSNNKKTLVIGGAGFIGSVLINKLLCVGRSVIVVDKLSLGTTSNLDLDEIDFYEEDINHYAKIIKLLEGIELDEVWHLAANSDIQAGVTDLDIDLNDTFLTTSSVLKIMKAMGCTALNFASSSAVYGINNNRLYEDIGPMMPISNYGAMKLASEALINASLESFLEKACIYRFPNVTGAPATHGVILDFVRKLKNDRSILHVLGNGSQQKSYLHVHELVDAMLFINKNSQLGNNYFNIGPEDDGVTVRQIAEATVSILAPEAEIKFGEKDRGWIGDVPKFFYSNDKLKKLGWKSEIHSIDAVKTAIKEIGFQEGFLN